MRITKRKTIFLKIIIAVYVVHVFQTDSLTRLCRWSIGSEHQRPLHRGRDGTTD
ncbi:hypothetical protein SH139x_002784 [Planctomycetaceae bacterium SH139]